MGDCSAGSAVRRHVRTSAGCAFPLGACPHHHELISVSSVPKAMLLVAAVLGGWTLSHEMAPVSILMMVHVVRHMIANRLQPAVSPDTMHALGLKTRPDPVEWGGSLGTGVGLGSGCAPA